MSFPTAIHIKGLYQKLLKTQGNPLSAVRSLISTGEVSGDLHTLIPTRVQSVALHQGGDLWPSSKSTISGMASSEHSDEGSRWALRSSAHDLDFFTH